jgi:hypothetical protein
MICCFGMLGTINVTRTYGLYARGSDYIVYNMLHTCTPSMHPKNWNAVRDELAVQ